MCTHSEVAQLRQQIALECEAMQRAMRGFSIGASHKIINQKYTNIGTVREQLAKLVGEEEATAIVMESYCHALEAFPELSEPTAWNEQGSKG